VNPESALLLASVRECLGTAGDGEVAAALRAPIDWPGFLKMAEAHAITPLAYAALERAGNSVPTLALELLRRSFQVNVVRNLALTGELLRLLCLFERQRIPAVPFKGPALACAIYGSLALRAFDDLDILVRREDFTRAGELLGVHGYRPETHLNRPQERMRFHWNGQLTFARGDQLVHVDLHWDLTPRHFPIANRQEAIWRNLAPVRVAGRQVLTLSPEDSVLYLCAHGSKHVWRRLAWLCDLTALIQRHEIDWRQVLAAAKGGEHTLALGLRLASEILGLRVPAEISAGVASNIAATTLTKQIQSGMFQFSGCPVSTRDTFLFNARIARGPWRRFLYGLGLLALPTEADWSAVQLPCALSFLYYPLRLVRLALKYGKAACSATAVPMS